MGSYLYWNALLFVIWALILLARKDLRKRMLATSLFFLPLGFTQPLFVPEYWNPTVIYKFFGLFDFESLMHVFFIGGISGASYNFITGSKKDRNISKKIYLAIPVLAAFLVFIKFFTSLSLMRSFLAFTSTCLVLVFIFRRHLINQSLANGLMFMIFYIASLILINLAFPIFTLDEWTFSGTLGIYLLNIPIEEYAYGFIFGAVGNIIHRRITN